VAGLSGKQYKTLYDGVITVPDGMWVAEAERRYQADLIDRYEGEIGEFETVNSWEYEVIGTANFKCHVLDHHSHGGYSHGAKSSWWRSLVVSEQPFGIVRWQTEYNDVMSGRYFICARQIHKGEMGAKPQIKRPKFARQASEPYRIGHQKKVRQHGWARLTDVATLAGMKPLEMLETYFQFTHAENPSLDVTFGKYDEIHGQSVPREKIVQYGYDVVRSLDLNDPLVWVRQGFAVTVLYLRHFGYMPRQVKVGSAS
jgi:hypothetical protein